jgi:sarcosine oxidase subunit beta
MSSTKRSDSFDVIVIGGGIMGLSSGYYLSKAGKRVLVLEKGEFGSGASGACDDMILLQSKKPGITLDMAFESLRMYERLEDELETDLELLRLGGMIMIESENHLRIMEEFVENQRRSGLDVEIVSRKELRQRQPHVNEIFIASTYSPRDSQVNPFRVMYGYQRAGQKLGLELRRRTEVNSIQSTGSGSWIAEDTRGEAYQAEVVLNAAGAWAPLIGRMVGVEIPIVPKRGQLIITEPIPPIGQTNAWSAEYIVTKLKPELAQPRDEGLEKMGLGFSFSRTADGNYFIGSTREEVNYDKGTTYEALQAVAAQAMDFFPILKHVHIIRHIAGLRPACRDGKPIIGEHPQRPGFFIAAGHEGDGIALAPITGKIASQLICGEKPTIDVTELSPSRFTQSGAETEIGSKEKIYSSP